MSINKVILVGNIGKDPDVKTLGENSKVANFTIATSERGYKNKAGVDVPEQTEWHNITAWNGLATLAEKYITKGSQIYLEGKIKNSTYEKDGVKHYSTSIVADVIQLLGKKNTGEQVVNEPENKSSEKEEDTGLPF